MYGAKASAIVKVAKDTFGVEPKNDEQEQLLVQSVIAIDGDNSIDLKELSLPKALQKEEYRRLVISLAKSPMVA